MYLNIKYLGLAFCFALMISGTCRAQDDQQPGQISTITLAVLVPPSIDGLTDASVAQLKNKITAIVTNNGLASDDQDKEFTIYPKFDINGFQETSATMQKIVVANCTLNLFIKQTSTKTIFKQCIKQIQGTGYTKDEAVANAVNQISPDAATYQNFIAAGKEKIVAYFQQNCQLYLTNAQREIAQGHYDEANKILAVIPQETGQCYDEGQQKTLEIFEKQYGSLDKAVTVLQKEVTIDPASSIFSKILDKAKNLLKKRNDDDKTPPEIELLTPKTTRGQTIEADVTPDEKIFVSGIAKDPSGIGSLSVNNTPITDIAPNGLFQTNISKDATGILIAVSDTKGNSTSITFHIAAKIDAQAAATNVVIPPIGDEEKFHAIFIANTKYTGSWAPLPSTISEAKELMKVFEDKYGFRVADVDTIFNKSRKEILKSVGDNLQKLTDNDNVVIFYGGHGFYTESSNTAYWVPVNAEEKSDFISNADISTLLADCKAKHILIMADACFSGAMRGGQEVPAKYEYKLKSRQILTSGGIESVPGKSAYVPMVMVALNNNTDKYFSVDELHSVIKNGIKNQGNTDSQLHVLQVNDSQGGEFYFRKN